MRVLWLDAEQNPWTDENGFTVLEQFGVSVDRIHQADLAREKILAGNFDLLVVNAEFAEALALLPIARQAFGKQKKSILCSAVWAKEDFKRHAKTSGAANRYASLPMSVEMFLKEAQALCGLSLNDQPPPPPTRTQTPSNFEDAEVLRKYLHMREEELGLLTSEREELHQDNLRLQKEVEKLQQGLRDIELAREELLNQAQQSEGRLAAAEEVQRLEKERFESELKMAQDKLKFFEDKLRDTELSHENLKLRVRKDIRKIRANERDLEARLEILRKDSETLLSGREQRLLEMQRKIDALEFDLDQVQDSRVQAELEAERYLAKLSRVARALHIAVGVIEEDQNADEELDELEPVLGGAAVIPSETPLQASVVQPIPEPEPAGSDATLVETLSPNVVVEDATSLEVVSPENAEELYASLAADGEPTRIAELSELDSPTDNNEGNEAAG